MPLELINERLKVFFNHCIIEEWKGPETAKGKTRLAPNDLPSSTNLSISDL